MTRLTFCLFYDIQPFVHCLDPIFSENLFILPANFPVEVSLLKSSENHVKKYKYTIINPAEERSVEVWLGRFNLESGVAQLRSSRNHLICHRSDQISEDEFMVPTES